MAEIVNLRRLRKRRERDERASQADQNRVLHGRSRQEKARDKSAQEMLDRHLDSHRHNDSAKP